MRGWILAGCCALMLGCVSTPEVKEASANIGVSLQTLQAAQAEFRDRFIAELEETRALIGRAIVNGAVVAKVGELAEQEEQGNLIAISQEIATTRGAYHRMVERVISFEPEDPDSEVLGLEGVLSDVQIAGLSEEATSDLIVLIDLAQTKQHVLSGMADFEAYIDFLELMHGEVNDWIVTDTTVDGADVASLLDRLQAQAVESGVPQ